MTRWNIRGRMKNSVRNRYTKYKLKRAWEKRQYKRAKKYYQAKAKRRKINYERRQQWRKAKRKYY